MKIGAGLFWGIILILIGIGLIIKVFFKVDFPIFKFIIAFVFIYIGMRILFGNFNINSRNWGEGRERDAIFSERHFTGRGNDENQYSAVFGAAKIDLTDTALIGKDTRIEVNVAFGGTEIYLNKDIPVRIKTDVAFGGVEYPDGDKSGAFGTSTFTSPNLNENDPHLYIRANVAFGGLEIKYR